MAHPLNDLKDLKKARAEIGRARKAADGAPITRAYFDSTISKLRAEFAEQLAPVLAALEVSEPDLRLDEELTTEELAARREAEED